MSTSKQVFLFNSKTNGSQAPALSWSKDSSYLAVGTENKFVYIVDKRGKVIAEKELDSKGRVIIVDWDNENELLAILQEGNSFVYLWAPFTTNIVEELYFDNQKNKITWLKWSKTHPVLTFGNEKGYINFYLKKNKKKIPTMGKHSKRIFTGDWNDDGLLVTGSEDKIITISSHTSENVGNSIAVRAEPHNIKWISVKNDDRERGQTTICTVFKEKAILVYDSTKEGSSQNELVFEDKYGKIIDYQFFGDGYIIVGFSEGYYCHISTHAKEIKDEIKSERVFNAPLEAMAVNNPYSKLALAGENKVKIIGLNDWKEIKQETFDLPVGCGKVAKMEFSGDGGTLIITTQSGNLFAYILSLNMQVSAYNELLAILSSLTEIILVNCSSKKKGQVMKQFYLPFEPTGITLGPNHVAARIGNTVKFYRWTKNRIILADIEEVGEITCEFAIKSVDMNETHVGILSDKNKVHLYEIEQKEGQTNKPKVFPLEADKQVVQFFMNKAFLILLDNSSKLKFYHIEDKNVVMEHKPDNQILRMFPNKNGTKIILQHQNGEVNLFFSATETYHHLKLVTDRVDNVLWDNENQNEFVLINGNAAYSYIVSRNNIFGNVVSPVNEILSYENVDNEEGEPAMTRIEKNVISLSNGNVFYMAGGTINYVPLTSHAFMANYKYENDSQEGHYRFFFLNISLKRFTNCLIAAKYIKNSLYYESLGKKALENLDLDNSLKAFQMGKNLAMVLTIQPLIHENERDLLIGHIAMVLGKYDIAQEYYLKSSEPLNALDMRCDIQDWFIASSLTKNIAPEQESFISKRLATQTESQGNNTEALKQFEKSVVNGTLANIEKSVIDKHNMECFAGIARTSIKLGDIQRGFNIGREIKDKTLLTDIAVVCENMKQVPEAAALYEKAEVYEKAVTLYLQQKNFKQAGPLMKKIKTPAILIKYGKAKESEGSYKDAEEAYEDAESWEDVVRINLNNFDNLEKPKDILRNKCSTSTVAQIVANYCEKRGFWKEAVEFSIMANRKEEAFVMAQTHSEMDTYADNLKECSAEERVQIAQYYEGKSSWDKAAKQYELSNNAHKALKLWIKAGELFIEKMIELIEKNSNQDHLIQELLDYLMGEADGQPKDPVYTYKLYRILKNFRNAAKIAVTIASQEQENGNYKNAHEILFQSYQDIKKANVPIPMELEKKLSILHSYVLAVKRVSKMEEHIDTAFLYDKVCKNILQFPVNPTAILTTAVIRAMKAELRALAYNWAIVVCRQEYKANIPEKYVERIKRVAMRPINEEIPILKSPCPFCKDLVPDFQDDCQSCQNYIPFCIASGKHVVGEDLAICNHCKFPTNHSYMKKMLNTEGIEKTCPMCNAEVTIDDYNFLGENGVSVIKRIAPPKEEKKETKDK